MPAKAKAAEKPSPDTVEGFLQGAAQELIESFKAELVDAKTALTEADRQAAAWAKLHGLPGIAPETRTRHTQPIMDKWRGESQALRARVTQLETDIQGLGLIVAQGSA